MQHTARTRRSRSSAPITCLLLPALAALAGCGSDAMSLGTDEVVAPVEASECSVSGDVDAASQDAVDALRGCTELPGDLRIRTWGDAPGSISLEPLSELRHVKGTLELTGPFTSLVGLESLEGVGALFLHDAQVTDLSALHALSRIEASTDWRSTFPGLFIENCDELTDLRGLENLTAWDSLEIGRSDGLVSLAGLQAPSRLESVIIEDAPQLSDLRALSPARNIGIFNLTRTAVTGLDSFELQRVETLYLAENPALSDLDGLSHLGEAESIIIADNDALVRMDLPELTGWSNLSVSGNDVLEAVDDANGGASWTSVASPIDGLPVAYQRQLLAISGNPHVTHISMLDALDVERVVINQNPSLSTLDMPAVTRADTLWLEDNAALSRVELPELHQVASLTVRNNPTLSVAPFANVKTLSFDVTGNLDALPASP